MRKALIAALACLAALPVFSCGGGGGGTATTTATTSATLSPLSLPSDIYLPYLWNNNNNTSSAIVYVNATNPSDSRTLDLDPDGWETIASMSLSNLIVTQMHFADIAFTKGYKLYKRDLHTLKLSQVSGLSNVTGIQFIYPKVNNYPAYVLAILDNGTRNALIPLNMTSSEIPVGIGTFPTFPTLPVADSSGKLVSLILKDRICPVLPNGLDLANCIFLPSGFYMRKSVGSDFIIPFYTFIANSTNGTSKIYGYSEKLGLKDIYTSSSWIENAVAVGGKIYMLEQNTTAMDLKVIDYQGNTLKLVPNVGNFTELMPNANGDVLLFSYGSPKVFSPISSIVTSSGNQITYNNSYNVFINDDYYGIWSENSSSLEIYTLPDCKLVKTYPGLEIVGGILASEYKLSNSTAPVNIGGSGTEVLFVTVFDNKTNTLTFVSPASPTSPSYVLNLPPNGTHIEVYGIGGITLGAFWPLNFASMDVLYINLENSTAVDLTPTNATWEWPLW